MVQETYMVEEDPQELAPVVSIETGEDGTTRRTETTVKETGCKYEKGECCHACHAEKI